MTENMDSHIKSARPGRGMKIALVLLVLAGAAGAFYAKNAKQSAPPPMAPPESKQAEAAPAALPRLVDLGADKCIPCKMMAPILDQLKTEFKGALEVEFIDVWKNPEAGEKYGVQMIPTQIFFDASGKELFRHSGFFAKEDILKKWKELGVILPEMAAQ